MSSRLATVHEMQQLLYEAAPYVPLVYPLTREVHSSAWQGWVKMPEANGSIWNRNTYIQVHPNVASTAVAGGSSGTGLIAIIVAVVAVVTIALVVLVRRRSRRSANSRRPEPRTRGRARGPDQSPLGAGQLVMSLTSFGRMVVWTRVTPG